MFKENRMNVKRKQEHYYNQHAHDAKELQTGERLRILQEGKWEPAIVLKNSDQRRSYIVKYENGGTYRRNRSHLLKSSTGEHQTIEISDDEDALNDSNGTPEENTSSSIMEEPNGNIQQQTPTLHNDESVSRIRSGRISR